MLPELLDEVISQRTAEIDSDLDQDYVEKRDAERSTRERGSIKSGEKLDEKRKSMQDLFRNRLKNNIGFDKLQQMSSSLHKRENWNYKIGYDG